MAAPIINTYPIDATPDVALATPLLIQCLPVGFPIAAADDINSATFDVVLTVDGVPTNVIINGVIQAGYDCTIGGSVSDHVQGIWWGGIKPTSGYWHTGKTYTVHAEVNNVFGTLATSTTTFSVVSTLDVTVFPEDAALDVPTRDAVRFRCVDQNPTVNGGVNLASLAATVTVGGSVRPAMVGGAFSSGFTGGILGDPLDPIDGLLIHIVPLSGKWLPNQEYTVTVSASTTNAAPVTPLTDTATTIFFTDSHIAYEDSTPNPTALEAYLISGGFPPYMEQLRDSLMRAVSSSGSGAVRARTILNLAYSTDIGGILKDWVDPDLADVTLYTRIDPITVYATMARHIPRVQLCTSEMTWLSSMSRNLIENRVRHDDSLYAVSALATLVTLGAIGKQEGEY